MAGERSFFVMLNSQNGKFIIPMTDDKDEVALFNTEDEARECAENNAFGEHFGFEIFERGYGSS